MTQENNGGLTLCQIPTGRKKETSWLLQTLAAMLAVAVAALKYKKPFGFYMNRIHTKRDTVFQEENIAYLTERTIRLIENM